MFRLKYSGLGHPYFDIVFAIESLPTVGCSKGGVIRRFCFFVSAILEHAHCHTPYSDAVVMEQGSNATQDVVTPPRATDRPAPLPPGCCISREQGGGKHSPCFVLYYVDNGILVEVQWGPDGQRCRHASASLASDYVRVVGGGRSRDPTLLSPHKSSTWNAILCVLGWDIDTVALTISVLVAKMERLRDKLSE